MMLNRSALPAAVAAFGRSTRACIAPALLAASLLAGSLLCAAPAAAQRTTADSLAHVLAGLKHDDTVKVRVQLQLAREMLRRQRTRAMELYREAYDLSARLHFEKGRAAALGGIGHCFIYQTQYDSALAYIRRDAEIAAAIPDSVLMARAENLTGLAHDMRGSRQEAITHYSLYRDMCLRMGRENDAASACLNLGGVYYDLGNYEMAMKQWEEALPKFEKEQDERRTATTLVNIANVPGNDARSIAYYERALRYYERQKEPDGIALVAVNLGATYVRLRQTDKAADLLERGLAAADALGDAQLRASINNNLGNVYKLQGNPRKARAQYEAALAYARERKDDGMISQVLISLAHADGCMGDLAASIAYAHEAEGYAERSGSATARKEIYGVLATLYKCSMQYEQAFRYLDRYSTVNDSVLNVESARKIAELNAKYDAEQRERTIAALEKDRAVKELEIARKNSELTRQSLLALEHERKLETFRHQQQEQSMQSQHLAINMHAQIAEIERKKNEVALLRADSSLKAALLSEATTVRNTFIAGLFFVLLATVLVMRNLQHRRRAEALRAEAAEYKAQAAEAGALTLQAESARRERKTQQDFARRMIAAQEAERKRIAGELHDSLGQDLLVIRNRLLLTLQNNGMSKELSTQIDAVCSLTATALGDVRQISRNLRPTQLDRVGLTSCLTATAQQLAESTETAFTYDISSADGLIPPAHEIHLYRIVQECLTNVCKHARASKAHLVVRRDNGNLFVHVEDDGIGFDPRRADTDHGPTTGIGLLGIRERIDILGGTLSLKSTPGRGTVIDIAIPVSHTDVKGTPAG